MMKLHQLIIFFHFIRLVALNTNINSYESTSLRIATYDISNGTHGQWRIVTLPLVDVPSASMAGSCLFVLCGIEKCMKYKRVS